MANLKKAELLEALSYLQQSPANCVKNTLSIKGKGGHAVSVRGYIGVLSETNSTLHGAFTWKNGTINTIAFEIPKAKGKPSITLLDHVPSYSLSDNYAMVVDFILAIGPRVKERWIENSQGTKKRGGAYRGRRLEAHQRHKTRPADHFNSVLNSEFTQVFIDLARNLHITYK